MRIIITRSTFIGGRPVEAAPYPVDVLEPIAKQLLALGKAVLAPEPTPEEAPVSVETPVEQPPEPTPKEAPVSVETPAEQTPEPKPEKPKGKGK